MTWSLLEEMRERPPDVLVIQSHHTLVERDIELIAELAGRCELWISLTVETDMEPRARVPAARELAGSPAGDAGKVPRRGVRTQATLSPLLPLADPERFAHRLARSATA